MCVVKGWQKVSTGRTAHCNSYWTNQISGIIETLRHCTLRRTFYSDYRSRNLFTYPTYLGHFTLLLQTIGRV
ncbi:uncharacterized protein H6S33_005381 [Morchella sextelata]|uniref:uncharacterized protein n=1 Tax=Morchella sextelata TaxID=1174677 RepID=UPI001D04765F|nr:uncharacterized protein H6S33_005381 [Morchella sextelata]KAH0613495.1 hypothetical protein H6S33_005381 [Morchella sextelata]